MKFGVMMINRFNYKRCQDGNDDFIHKNSSLKTNSKTKTIAESSKHAGPALENILPESSRQRSNMVIS